ncbi:MAG TPA: SHOCT domain-containing protein [Candidatus Acidoferrum sp.]|nr:SHOCT domain-containing protein [Candidatus Acidoferrum sp.]
MNDTQAPYHDIAFMNIECKKSSPIYTLANQQARHWHGVIEILVKRAEVEERTIQPNAHSAPKALAGHSIADELRKFADLHKAGIITEEEFRQQKAKLLAGDQL